MRLRLVRHFGKKFISTITVSFFFGIVISLFLPATAYAHSQIVDSNPSPDQTLFYSPKKITLEFSESVTASRNAIRLYDQNADQIELISKTEHIDSKTIQREIPNLKNGIYIVSWAITSADTHPVSGAYTFNVGEKKNVIDIDKRIAQVLQGNSISKELKLFALINKWLLFAALSIMIAITVLSFFNVISITANLKKYLLISLFLSFLTSIAALVIQAAFVQEVSFITALKPDLLLEQLQTHFGLATIARMIFCILLYFVLTKMNKSFLILAFILSVDVAVTISLSGHGVVGKMVIFAILFSVLHVMATFTWLGSLILIVINFRQLKTEIDYKKFSRIAIVCVLVTFVTGAFAWYRQIGPWEYATNSFFGKLVLAKIAITIATVFVAFFARRKVLSENTSNRIFKRIVSTESLALLVVLALTSVLVSAVPARQSANIEVVKQVNASNKILELRVDPAKVGSSELHVYIYKRNGLPYQIQNGLNSLSKSSANVSISNSGKKIGPIEVPMRFQGLNHFSAAAVQIPFSGIWTITIRIQIDEFNEVSGSFKVKYL